MGDSRFRENLQTVNAYLAMLATPEKHSRYVKDVAERFVCGAGQ